MKKLENPKWEECRDYLRNTILPRLQEIQRDLFGDEFLVPVVSVGGNGEYVSAHISVMKDTKVLNSVYQHFCFCDSREKIDSQYAQLTEFIEKYKA
jgi:hypothetical protein|nr:MAG TPA: hypothetical protein [Caudoviricetes sp.]